ncbi:HNH endonuclease [Mariniflexile ostreae]|uniref:HNH endonuclease n=1 Tax=Mariniflexile ostreae TaxID=1520892 RepID=A0ABV5FB97_9FLAO
MLRLYDPIQHDVFTLNTLLEHLVCNVWCEACNDLCEDKLQDEFKVIYNYSVKKEVTLKSEVERIYILFKGLTEEQKNLTKQAFTTNNSIEVLCNGGIPIYLNQLPKVVNDEIKPLFKWCYETLLDKGKVAGDKMDYYKALIKHNDFITCPCCGLIDFESFESKYREAYDHYLPKSKYPFASVNFQNLVPLCYKCNSDRKKAKDPIEKNRVVFYPFSTEEHTIEINSDFILGVNEERLDIELNNFKITFIGNTPKIETWNWLFDIEERYSNQIKGFSKTFLTKIRRRHKKFLKLKADWTFINTIDYLIEDYEHDYYDDKKFLKIAFLKVLKKDDTFLQTCA